jgi:hypothetical protein
MTRFNNPLNNVRVAAPCNADWEQMFGNERARFCGQCNLNVYNLSSMTRSEAEHLIASNEGRLCVRFYRRADGSILTKNCPVGLRAIQRKISTVTKAIVSAVLSFLAGVGIYESFAVTDRLQGRGVMGTIAQRQPEITLPPPTPPAQERVPIMGGVPILRERPPRNGIGSRGKPAYNPQK